jgi:hypothetical protein
VATLKNWTELGHNTTRQFTLKNRTSRYLSQLFDSSGCGDQLCTSLENKVVDNVNLGFSDYDLQVLMTKRQIE